MNDSSLAQCAARSSAKEKYHTPSILYKPFSSFLIFIGRKHAVVEYYRECVTILGLRSTGADM